MKMNTLYAALSGAFLLGTAALSDAQNMTTTDDHRQGDHAAVGRRAHHARQAGQGDDRRHPGPNAGEGISRDEYKREKDRIEADAKAAKEKCKSLDGNTKDICQAEAKANEKVAKKELDYKNKPTEKNRYDLEKMKAEARTKSRRRSATTPRQDRLPQAGQVPRRTSRWRA
jgi:hypothetical protein